MMAKEYDPKPVQLCLPLGDPMLANVKYTLPARFTLDTKTWSGTPFVKDDTLVPGVPYVVPSNHSFYSYDTLPMPTAYPGQEPTEWLSACRTVPVRLGQDQYRCANCGHVWDVDEARPPCEYSAPTQEPDT